jgi:hypothetical protein
VNTAQQIGGSLGVAVLNTIAAGATAGFLGSRAEALVHGYSVAAGWGTAILLLAALAAAALIVPPAATRPPRHESGGVDKIAARSYSSD